MKTFYYRFERYILENERWHLVRFSFGDVRKKRMYIHFVKSNGYHYDRVRKSYINDFEDDQLVIIKI